MAEREDLLPAVLNRMFGKQVKDISHRIEELKGGTVGDVQLVSGTAYAEENESIPYRVVWKKQKKWERPGDPDSWRKEYDLYQSGLDSIFSQGFSWPKCYASNLNEHENEMWLEFIDGASGERLTIQMLEKAAYELGLFQGITAKRYAELSKITCLSDTCFLRRDYEEWHKQRFSYDFLISKDCIISDYLKSMIRNGDITIIEGKSFEYSCLRSKFCDIPKELKQMIIDIDNNMDKVFAGIEKLPVVLCHRDFWSENVFYKDGNIRAIDWDTAGFGFIGEDIASLIVDEMPVEQFEENYRRLIPAYLKGLSVNMEVPQGNDLCIFDMILIKFGYRNIQNYIFSENEEDKRNSLDFLQKIYELRKK